MPVPIRLRPIAMLLALVLSLAALLAAPLGSARADDIRVVPDPVRLLLVTSGLTWEDVSAQATPTLQCLADRSGVAAMNASSTTMVSTRAQGSETIRTGYRGLAAEAPPSAGIPDPPRDLLASLPEPPQVLDLPSVPARGEPGRTAALTELDAAAAEALAPSGGCSAADLPRTLLVSVGSVDGPTSETAHAGDALLSETAQLQAVMDSGRPGELLSSGATHQRGVVVLTDVVPTLLAAAGEPIPPALPGQAMTGVADGDAQQIALDRTRAARLVDLATVPALGSWAAPGLLGLIVLLVPALARRPRPAAVARALVTIAPLAIPVGLCAGLVPWWRGEHPVWALTAWVWAGSVVLATVALAGPWRRWRLGPPGVAGALIAAVLLLESATGSRLQLGSPLGAQAIWGGRYYGLSNHLFGAVLAGSLLALLAVLSRLRTRRAHLAATIVTGLVVAGICVAPSMGADFGSMLVTVPTFGILALLVSGIRVRPWHVLALGAGGTALVMGISLLDWLRPPEQRSHLGRFIDAILTGELASVVSRKLAQNVGMLLDYWPLAAAMVLAVVLTVAMLAPGRFRLARLTALDERHPTALPIRIALAIGTWAGFALNDTGAVLVLTALGVTLCLLTAMLPDPEDGPATAG